MKPTCVVRNEVEGFLLGRFFRSTEKCAKYLTPLIEPQGKIKK